jgi:HlyD family secretion protein
MDEVDAPKLRIGQFARITIDALPGQTFPGKVRRVAPYVTEVEKQARTVDIEVDFEEIPERPLLVGYSADVEVVIERHENVLGVPTQAIRQGGKVLLVNEEKRLVEHKLETGLANWAFTEVTGGLKEGDRVLLSSEAKEIKAGMQVREKVAEQ